MNHAHHIARVLAPILLVLLAGATALADNPGTATTDESSRLVTIGGGDESFSVELDGSELTIITGDGDDVSVRSVDVSQVALLVGEALEDMDEVFSALDDMQFSFNLGGENYVDVSHPDRSWELDLDEIMVQVGDAVSAGLAEIHHEDWSHTDRGDHDLQDMQHELRRLKRELREMRRELRSLEDAGDG